MESLDLTKEIAEKLLMRIMEPVRKKLFEAQEQKWPDSEEMGLTLAILKEMDRDLGAIGLTLANRYREQAEFRTSLTMLAQENVRLTGAVSVLSELLEQEKEQSKSLANSLEKTKTVNGKLKELTGTKWGST